MEAFSALWAVLYLFYAYFVLQRVAAYGKVAKYMILYSSVAILVEILHAARSLGWLDILGMIFWTWQRSFGIFILGIFFLGTTFAFVNGLVKHRWWIISTSAWALLIVFLMFGMGLPGLSVFGEWKNLIISIAILLGWMALLAANGSVIVSAFRSATKPLHKNRFVFWACAVFILAIGDVFIFFGQDFLGSLFRISGLLLAGYIVFFQDLLDLSGTIQRLPLTVYKTIVAFIFYATVLSIHLPINFISESSNRIVELLLKALILVAGVNPILILINQFVDRTSTQTTYSQSSVVRKYNLAIAQIVDLNRLAEVAIHEIKQVLQIQSARMYLVERSETDGSFIIKEIHPLKGKPSVDVEVVKLGLAGSIVHHFNQHQKPLFQYDLDFSPRFSTADLIEKTWFTEQQMDIYIPIYTFDTWVGLFALGPKLSGNRYFEEDLELLTTLAEQTVIALQNARLVEDLRLTQNMLESANAKLRSIDESKSAFISVVTHELRTPMVNIGFSLQLIDLYGKERLLPEQRELIEQLARSVQVARALIDNLISYASFLNEQVILDLSSFDFCQAIKDCLVPFQRQAQEKEVQFHLEISEEPLMTTGDRKMLMDAVRQLVSNAIKFTQTGSVWIACRQMNGAVCFEVQDTGIGIPPDKLTVIWEAFMQATSDSLRRGMEGLGLGLALVKLIVESHGGFVWVESILNSGSFFGFQVPISGPSNPMDESVAMRLQHASLKRSVTWQVRQRNIYESEQ